MPLPPDHPLRQELNDEVHARPSDQLIAPKRLSYLALASAGADSATRAAEWQELCDLLVRCGAAAPAKATNHHVADLGTFRLRFERHTEFRRYTFMVKGLPPGDDPFAEPALSAVPADWIKALGGSVVVATHAVLMRADTGADNHEAIAQRHFAGNVLVGSAVGDQAAIAYTDFRVREDGFSRVLVLDKGLTPRQAGRTLQRLFELDTYRIMALLALPVARELGPFLTQCERELSEVTTVLSKSREEDEPALFDRLTRLEAEIETRESANDYRFGAAAAYYELVLRRIAEMREQRLPGLQTFLEFTERRLAPAMATCRTVVTRQESLSARVARANQLLSTRVAITRERQNQALLESMDKRARAQLVLQETVEGLSIAAVTYYIVGLVGYVAKGLHEAGAHVVPEVAQAVSVPIVVVLVAVGIGRIRRLLKRNKP